MATTALVAEPTRSFGEGYARYARLLAWATTAGLVAGVPVLGLGGRLAMRVIAATSPASVQGAFTDAGEEIGEITLGGTIGLLIFGGVLFGVAGGWLYAFLRPLLPGGLRAKVGITALAAAAVALPANVAPEGRDFSILRPLWLAVLLFVLLGPLYALVLVPFAERTRNFYETTPLRFPQVMAFAPLILLLPFVPLAVLAAVVGVVWAAAWAAQVSIFLRARPVLRVAAGMLAVALLAVGIVEVTRLEARPPSQSDFVDPF